MASERRGRGVTDTHSTRSMSGSGEGRGELWVVVSDEAGVRVVPLPSKRRIGRSRSCDVVVEDGSVSREHAALFDVAGTLQIEDLGSRNKTRLVGTELAAGESLPVGLGAVVSVGSATLVLQRGRPAAAPPRKEPSAADAPVVAEDAAMKRLLALLDVVGPSPLPVLLLGETGTGKEVFAERLHARSPRAEKALVRVNCAALGGSLLESELFGHEKGAFTGAATGKPGVFEAADGGTLFLDEIGEMPEGTQAKVLRVIEHGEVTRLGSTKPRRIDVRYVAATHRDLPAWAAEGRFRSDLFFRLNGYAMTIPPLRERKDDVAPLARWFLARAAVAGRPPRAIDEDALARLAKHTWPGNVRELRTVIDRALVLSGAGPIGLAHLVFDGALPAPEPAVSPLRSRRSSFEYEHVLRVLEQTGGDRKAAAALLGIAYRTLLEKLAENGHPSARTRK